MVGELFWGRGGQFDDPGFVLIAAPGFRVRGEFAVVFEIRCCDFVVLNDVSAIGVAEDSIFSEIGRTEQPIKRRCVDGIFRMSWLLFLLAREDAG